MPKTHIPESTELGLAAGRQLGGDAIRKLLVEPGDTWTGDPFYHFCYQPDIKVLPPRHAKLMSDPTIKLIEKLFERRNDTTPLVHF